MIWAVVNACWMVRYAAHPVEPISALLAFSYRLYAVPLAFALFLRTPDRIRSSRHLPLDFLQIGLFVTLVFVGMFYVPTQHLSDEGRLAFATRLGDVINTLLLLAYLLRWRFEVNCGLRRVHLRVLLFVAAYTIVSFIGNRVELPPMSAHLRWIDLFWSLPYFCVAALAANWSPATGDNIDFRIPNPFRSLLVENLILAILVVVIDSLADSLEGTWHTYGNIAVAVSFLTYALRLNLCTTSDVDAGKPRTRGRRAANRRTCVARGA
jgi:hypothetical protein